MDGGGSTNSEIMCSSQENSTKNEQTERMPTGTKEAALGRYKEERAKLKKITEKQRDKRGKNLLETWKTTFGAKRIKSLGKTLDAQAHSQEQMKEAKKLFPAHPRKIWPHVNGQEQDFSPLTGEDLREAASKIKTGKAPGPDGIPAVIVKAAICHEENYVLETINKIWKKRTFPAAWKTGRLVLIEKQRRKLTLNRHNAQFVS